MQLEHSRHTSNSAESVFRWLQEALDEHRLPGIDLLAVMVREPLAPDGSFQVPGPEQLEAFQGLCKVPSTHLMALASCKNSPMHDEGGLERLCEVGLVSVKHKLAYNLQCLRAGYDAVSQAQWEACGKVFEAVLSLQPGVEKLQKVEMPKDFMSKARLRSDTIQAASKARMIKDSEEARFRSDVIKARETCVYEMKNEMRSFGERVRFLGSNATRREGPCANYPDVVERIYFWTNIKDCANATPVQLMDIYRSMWRMGFGTIHGVNIQLYEMVSALMKTLGSSLAIAEAEIIKIMGRTGLGIDILQSMEAEKALLTTMDKTSTERTIYPKWAQLA